MKGRHHSWRYQSDADLRRGPMMVVGLVAIAIGLVILAGCSGLDAREQKTVSGAAIGGTLGCGIGAGIGALIGYVSGHSDEH